MKWPFCELKTHLPLSNLISNLCQSRRRAAEQGQRAPRAIDWLVEWNGVAWGVALAAWPFEINSYQASSHFEHRARMRRSLLEYETTRRRNAPAYLTRGSSPHFISPLTSLFRMPVPCARSLLLRKLI